MVADALRTLAWREDREPRRQAERFIREGLERAGALPITVNDYCEVPNQHDLAAGKPAPVV